MYNKDLLGKWMKVIRKILFTNLTYTKNEQHAKFPSYLSTFSFQAHFLSQFYINAFTYLIHTLVDKIKQQVKI